MIVQGELAQRLDDYLSRITPFGFSGAALLAKDGQIVLNKGYGLANRAEGVPNTAQTVFSLGSITKQFTASARPRPSTASVSTPRPALLLQSLGRPFRRDTEGTYQHAGRAKRAHTSAPPSLIVTEIARPFHQGSALPGR